ncbi:phosphatase PAP2 family protein [Streptomyces fagopyri]|uniref:phosphatase PAP2 family protein n=1 Tax=Streptomyces fagopyri TaxID=2662397 RepID=UPI0033E370CA
MAKWSTRGPRPLLDLVPPVRRLTRRPHTTSFPSGHCASAAAFATAVALESAGPGALVAAFAAAVAVSRVYVGVHCPGDVLAGVAIGVGAAALTARWWSPRPTLPERERPPVPAPALPGGTGLVVLVDGAAGSADKGRRGRRPPADGGPSVPG